MNRRLAQKRPEPQARNRRDVDRIHPRHRGARFRQVGEQRPRDQVGRANLFSLIIAVARHTESDQ